MTEKDIDLLTRFIEHVDFLLEIIKLKTDDFYNNVYHCGNYRPG